MTKTQLKRFKGTIQAVHTTSGEALEAINSGDTDTAEAKGVAYFTAVVDCLLVTMDSISPEERAKILGPLTR